MYKMAPAAFNDPNNLEKRKCRTAIVDAVNATGIVPKTIFTLPGENAYCARLFRETWGMAPRIVAIERSSMSADITYAHISKCEVYCVNFERYSKKENPIIRVIHRETRKPDQAPAYKKSVLFDYPKFDLAYIDLCSTPSNMGMIMMFMLNHTNINSIIAVTMQATSQTEAEATTDGLLSLGSGFIKLDIKQYETGGKNHMMLAILKRIS